MKLLNLRNLGRIFFLFQMMVSSTVCATSLKEVRNFGSNPGRIRMFKYVPEGVTTPAPMVVVLHGCTQSAATFDDETGWIEMANRGKFVLLFPEQTKENNGMNCFNWFTVKNVIRGSGEMGSVAQMIEKMKKDEVIDQARIFVTGLSAGGALAVAMLAHYPEVFQGAGIVAGIPVGCARDVSSGFMCMNGVTKKSAKEWGDIVRAAKSHQGKRARISIWQGTADPFVKPTNAVELVKQWTNVFGISETPSSKVDKGTYDLSTFKNSEDETLIELYDLKNAKHGQPVKPGSGEENCGKSGSYIIDAGVCAALEMSKTWGLITTK